MKPRDGPAVEMKETTMTTKSTNSAPAKPPLMAGKPPTHRLYRVTGEGAAAFWTPIGAAWPNKDGKGFNISCDAVPLTGRIVLRLVTPRVETEGGQP